MFLTSNPFFFGPLVLIERLFRAYDANNAGQISEEVSPFAPPPLIFFFLLLLVVAKPDVALFFLFANNARSFSLQELFTMLLDMEVEKNVEEGVEPDVQALQLRARELTFKIDPSGTGLRDGHLDFLNFVHMVHCHPELVGSAVFIRPYFDEADADGNHTLDAGELQHLLRSLLTDLAVPPGIQDEITASVRDIMKAMDEDGDGRIVRVSPPTSHPPNRLTRFISFAHPLRYPGLSGVFEFLHSRKRCNQHQHYRQ